MSAAIPTIRFERGIRQRYEVAVPEDGFLALTQAAELDTTGIDEFGLVFRAYSPRNMGTTVLTTKLLVGSAQTSHDLNVTIYLDKFVGYGQFGYNLLLGSQPDAAADEIDNANLSGIVLHELVHCSRLAKKIRGERIKYLPRVTHTMGDVGFRGGKFHYYGEDERYVQYQTFNLIRDNPSLSSLLAVKKYLN